MSPLAIQQRLNKLLIGRANMNSILGVVKNGRVEVDAPPDWPDGTLVRVEIGLNGLVEYDDKIPEPPAEFASWL
jgi:hypothetical protein